MYECIHTYICMYVCMHACMYVLMYEMFPSQNHLPVKIEKCCMYVCMYVCIVRTICICISKNVPLWRAAPR